MLTKSSPHATLLLRRVLVGALAACTVSCAGPGSRSAEETAAAEANAGPGATTADNGSRPVDDELPPGAPVQGVATFTAADTARILLVLEQGALSQARLGAEHGVTVEVKTYAAKMVADRTEAVSRLGSILARVRPRSEDATARLFEIETRRTTDTLASFAVEEFDLPFMTAEVGAHARLLGMLDASLLPSASAASATTDADDVTRELDQELRAIRASTAQQILHALRVQGVVRAALGAPETTGGDTRLTGSTMGEAPPRTR